MLANENMNMYVVTAHTIATGRVWRSFTTKQQAKAWKKHLEECGFYEVEMKEQIQL